MSKGGGGYANEDWGSRPEGLRPKRGGGYEKWERLNKDEVTLLGLTIKF